MTWKPIRRRWRLPACGRIRPKRCTETLEVNPRQWKLIQTAASDRGGQRAAFMYSLIVTAKLNDVDPQAWLADVLARIADHPSHQLDDLLQWNWAAQHQIRKTA